MPLSPLETAAVEQAAAHHRGIEVEYVDRAMVAVAGGRRLFSARDPEYFKTLMREADEVMRRRK